MGGGFRTACLLGLVLSVGAFLGIQAYEAYQGAAEAYRENVATEEELERLRRENRALKDESDALENDPIYIESVLRGWKMAAPGETIVEK